MKKALKIFGIILGILLLVVIGFIIYIQAKGIPYYENKAPADFKVQMDSINIAEGTRIASIMCAGCHLSEDGKLGGALMPDTKEFGVIYSSNITQHPKLGITDYTDGELAYLMRTGIKKNGQYSPPWMPKFPHLSDEDLNNIIAFLRSDHKMVSPSANEPPASKPSFLTKMLCNVAFGPLPYPERIIPEPDENDPIAFGKYVSTAQFDCFGCHSEDFKTQNIMEPEKTPGFMGGGNTLLRRSGEIVLSPNLTMDEKTGLGSWTEEEFIKCVKYGILPDGKGAIAYPMAPFAQMTDHEASSIWAYLQSIPVIHNQSLLDEGKDGP